MAYNTFASQVLIDESPETMLELNESKLVAMPWKSQSLKTTCRDTIHNEFKACYSSVIPPK